MNPDDIIVTHDPEAGEFTAQVGDDRAVLEYREYPGRIVFSHTEVPVAVGFGISTPEHARQAADAGADGVIVGTRLVRAAGDGRDAPAAVSSVVGELAAGLARSR